MQILNLQDGIVKSPLVSTVQNRAAEILRAGEIAADHRHAEQAREAEEVTQETSRVEQDEIHPDEGRDQSHPDRRRRRRPSAAPAVAPSAEPRPAASAEPSGGHKIDIVI